MDKQGITRVQFRLQCAQDPRALGIELEDGAWDLNKFEEHLKQCPVCGKFVVEMGSEVMEAVVNAVFLRNNGKEDNG